MCNYTVEVRNRFKGLELIDRVPERQAGIKIAGRNINNLRVVDGIALMAESTEERLSLLMKVKDDSEEKLA